MQREAVMADVFGPTFSDEVIAAGLGGLPFGWSASTGEIYYRDQLTPEQSATLDGVISAHDNTKPAPPTLLEQLAARIAALETAQPQGKK
jgi:hypothetical protein